MFGADRFNRGVVALGRLLPVVAFTALLIASVGTRVSAQETSSYADELRRLTQDIRDLQRYVYSESFGGQPPKPGPVEGGGKPLPADAATRLHFKLQALEAQLMSLTGRLEEMENGVRRSENRLNRLVSDVDLRLRAIETKTGISPALQGPALSGVVPAQPGQAPPPPGAAARGGLAPGQQLFGTVSPSDVDKVKPGRAPTGAQQAAILPVLSKPAPAPSAAPSPGGVSTAKPQAAASAGKVALLPKGTPKQQYAYAFGLLKKRDFANAARSLKAFIEKNPKHELAGNAMYWLGETHYDQQQYAEAARVFLDGYRRYPKSNKAPDNLLKLGKALNSVGEKKSACATWKKLLKDYPKASLRLVRNAKSAISKNKCR